jgi:hypothetical protein
MKFKVDENLPAELVYDLRRADQEAETVTDENLSGAPDSIVLERVRSEGRVLLTLDKGIGDIRTYPPQQYAGIVLFRPQTTGRGATLSFVCRHLDTLLRLDLVGHLVVVTERGIRIR